MNFAHSDVEGAQHLLEGDLIYRLYLSDKLEFSLVAFDIWYVARIDPGKTFKVYFMAEGEASQRARQILQDSSDYIDYEIWKATVIDQVSKYGQKITVPEICEKLFPNLVANGYLMAI